MGKLKDECAENVITEASSLKDKLYAYKKKQMKLNVKV